ncbi:MAG: hypothetical protein HQL15_06600 [Candidatus Omnitrophica bacterium]|nr:hypothetical protein [Candidatus Omnitrophota bacterium]
MMTIYKLLKTSEHLFLLLIILSIGYMGYFFFNQNKMMNSLAVLPPEASIDLNNRDTMVSMTEARSYDVFTNQIDARDIFSSPKQENLAKQSNPAGQLPDNLKVVGIVFANPVQVVIEDTTNHQTFFIEQGAAPENGISIKSALKDKVILMYQGQDIEVQVKGNQINAH